jgi:GNAT superfamily N-acetyltransferase
VTLRLVDEIDLSVAERRAIGALLVKELEYPAAAQRGWTQMPPTFRCLAVVEDAVIAQRSVVRVPCEPPVCLFGFGDLVVAPRWRRRGIARAMTELAVEEAWRRGAEVLLTATRPMEKVYRSLGFESVPYFCFYCVQDDMACVWNPDWLCAWRGKASIRPRVKLEGPF